MDHFEDRELLGELFRRGRLRSVEAKQNIDPLYWELYSHEPGFIRHVHQQLARMTSEQLLHEGQFHFDIGPVRMDQEFNVRLRRVQVFPAYREKVEAKSDLWIITQPPHRQSGDGAIR